MRQTVAQCYSDYLIEEDRGYKIQRQPHIQFRDISCKVSKEDTQKNEEKEPEDTRGEDEFGY